MPIVNRREFIRSSLTAAGATMLAGKDGFETILPGTGKSRLKDIKVARVSSNFEREPLIRPFGFKGGYMKEIWQTAAFMEVESGNHSIGLCSQSVLWSDANVFSSFSEAGGNSLMYSMTERALQLIHGQPFSSPVQLLEDVYPEVFEYGKKITANSSLRKTFALNALVAVDNAAWLLFAKENGFTTFDAMIPDEYRPALSMKHKSAAAIPLMAYSIPVEEIKAAAGSGYFFMKVKIGQPGTQEEMLEKDKLRISEIHKAIGNVQTSHTVNGKLPYYFDANGRYEKKETLMKLIDHCRSIGAFEQIMIIEEPFPEEYEVDVTDIPLRLACDESAHTEKDSINRIEMGYGAVALKAIAKTLSMTLKIAKAAHDRNIPCFCADLTVNPILIDWNKNVAARLSPFPGIGNLGLIESNGHQNYKNWNSMMGYYPARDKEWVKVNNGLYSLDEEFYDSGGGIFETIPHYEQMFV
ncbi:MAG TPA: enolase C-terminal domain-like protein [Bacteroidales bacterium]|nr:enolase C-terminal domain-like protein [Bacteroidales bacterium]